MHPLYPVARRLVGRPVIAHHLSGRHYSGVLRSVTPNGVYMMTAPVVVSGTQETGTALVELAIADQGQVEPSLVYSPAAFFGFGALTGFTLGALAARPYGYGYGYPGFYW